MGRFPRPVTSHEYKKPLPKELPEETLLEDGQPSLDSWPSDEQPPISKKPPRQIHSLLDQVISDARNHIYPNVFHSAQEFVAIEGARSPELYQILIQACADAPGCVLQDLAFKLLEEMKSCGLPLTQDIYYSLLKLLSKSPDYLARTQVLEEMNEQWIRLNGQAWEWVISGYLSDGQLEMVLDVLDECVVAGEKIGKGVYLAVVRHLVALREIDEALRLVQEAKNYLGNEVEGEFMTSESWHDLLLAAAEDLHV
jgi:hypothetical protein